MTNSHCQILCVKWRKERKRVITGVLYTKWYYETCVHNAMLHRILIRCGRELSFWNDYLVKAKKKRYTLYFVIKMTRAKRTRFHYILRLSTTISLRHVLRRIIFYIRWFNEVKRYFLKKIGFPAKEIVNKVSR